MSELSGVVKRIKSKGPRTEPCGTPQVRGSVQKSDRTKERHNERATKFKRATKRKSDKIQKSETTKEQHNERATQRKNDIK